MTPQEKHEALSEIIQILFEAEQVTEDTFDGYGITIFAQKGDDVIVDRREEIWSDLMEGHSTKTIEYKDIKLILMSDGY